MVHLRSEPNDHRCLESGYLLSNVCDQAVISSSSDVRQEITRTVRFDGQQGLATSRGDDVQLSGQVNRTIPPIPNVLISNGWYLAERSDNIIHTQLHSRRKCSQMLGARKSGAT